MAYRLRRHTHAGVSRDYGKIANASYSHVDGVPALIHLVVRFLPVQLLQPGHSLLVLRLDEPKVAPVAETEEGMTGLRAQPVANVGEKESSTGEDSLDVNGSGCGGSRSE